MMYQIIVERKLHGRGIFVTEDRNEPNMAPTPTADGRAEERPVILGRKLAAKERRTLLETRNRLKKDFKGIECHISPTAKAGATIEGPCMACPVCFTHGGLRSGKGGSYGRAGIVLYDDAFSLGDSELQMLTMNAVDTKTQRTGTALASETFVYGGTFLNVVTVKHDAPEILNLVLDSIASTNSYGARSRHYGRMMNRVVAILSSPRPVTTSYELVQMVKNQNDVGEVTKRLAKERSAKLIDPPKLESPEDVLLKAHKHPDVQAWYKEVEPYLSRGDK